MSGSDDLLGRLYSSASVFIYPSLYEGFGIPPLEAMAHDCPVAASNTSSIPEVVGEAAELFDPEDQGDMRAAMERIACSAEHARALVSKGRRQIEKFTWDACAQATLDVYRQITGT
jgi:glycosyltransferase involved in cell wall biosynthesis